MQVRISQSALAGATTEQLVDLLNDQDPPRRTTRVYGAVCLLVGERTTMKHARKLFKSWQAFMEMLTIASTYPVPLTPSEAKKVQAAVAGIQKGEPEPKRPRLVVFLERWLSAVFELMKRKGLVEGSRLGTGPGTTPNEENGSGGPRGPSSSHGATTDKVQSAGGGHSPRAGIQAGAEAEPAAEGKQTDVAGVEAHGAQPASLPNISP